MKKTGSSLLSSFIVLTLTAGFLLYSAIVSAQVFEPPRCAPPQCQPTSIQGGLSDVLKKSADARGFKSIVTIGGEEGTENVKVGIGVINPSSALHVLRGGFATSARTNDLAHFGFEGNISGNRQLLIQQWGNANTAKQFIMGNGFITDASPSIVNGPFTRASGLMWDDDSVDVIINDTVGVNKAGSIKSAVTIKSDTGNVGIGTPSPSQKFDVQGGSIALAASEVIGSGKGFGCSGCGQAGTIELYNGSTGDMTLQSGTNYDLALNPSGGNVGIGTVSPGAHLDINKTSPSLFIEDSSNVTGPTSSSRFTQFVNGLAKDGSNNWSDIFVYGQSVTGNIGKTNILKARATFFEQDSEAIVFGSYYNKPYYFVQNIGEGSEGSPVYTLTLAAGGNVGIGTTDPKEKLEVLGGKMKITNQDNGYGWIYAQDPNHSIILRGNRDGGVIDETNYYQYGDHVFYTGGALKDQKERLRIKNNGNIGIGTAKPKGTLEVSGGTAADTNKALPIILSSQQGYLTGAGGDLSFSAGAGGYNGTTAGSVGGSVALSAGRGGYKGVARGGSVSLIAGDGSYEGKTVTSIGGHVIIQAGAGGYNGSANGGNVTITAGKGSYGGNANGGDIVLIPGGKGGGTDSKVGNVRIGNTKERYYLELSSKEWPEVRFTTPSRTADMRIGMAHANDSSYGVNEGDFYIYSPQTNSMNLIARRNGGVSIPGNLSVGGNLSYGSISTTGTTCIGGGALCAGAKNEIWTQNGMNAEATLHINHRGYADGQSQFRNLSIRNGKGGELAFFQGSTGNVGIGITDPGEKLDVNGYLRIRSINGEGGTIRLDGNNGKKMYVENLNGSFRLVDDPWQKELFSVSQSGDASVRGTIYASDWFRSYGNTGWYSQTYGGGWYMEDSTWIRTYNQKNVWTGSGLLGSNGGLTVGYGGTGPNTSGGAIIAGNVGIGTTSPTHTKLEIHGTGSQGLTIKSTNRFNYLVNDDSDFIIASDSGITGYKAKFSLTAPDNSFILDASGNSRFAAYSTGAANVNTYSMEVGGTAPTSTNGQATIFLHDWGDIAHQLRYTNGNLYLERAGNGYGTSDNPNLYVGGWLGGSDWNTNGGFRLGRWPGYSSANNWVYLSRANSTIYADLAVGSLYTSGNLTVISSLCLSDGCYSSWSGAISQRMGASLGASIDNPYDHLYVRGGGGHGQIRVAPSTSNEEASIGFYRRNDFSTEGTHWVIGVGAWHPSNADFLRISSSDARGIPIMTFDDDSAGGSVGIGMDDPNNTYRLHVAGSINLAYFDKQNLALSKKERLALASDLATDRIGLDIAELYEADEKVEVGDVIVTSDKERRVKKSTRAYQEGILGIVSGSPAIVFEGSDVIAGSKPNRFKKGIKPPIALAGRVPVKVSLENGEINPGDYLTSSSVPGVAMKATEPGSTLGVALEKYDIRKKENTVLVLVNIAERNMASVVLDLQKRVKELEARQE
ncbi:hypothetical protein HY621_04180 [Candidatus Uhrbacteria bacterium]|nr:hypothetical protein [Candidatus Uhrbacteria bacterium]